MTREELSADVASIREEYGRRDVAAQCRGVYTFENPVHAYLVFERERAILAALARHLTVPLHRAAVLDVGCSSGLSLAFLAIYGASPDRLHGVDIVESRLEAGRSAFPGFGLRLGDGVDLPYEDRSFDLVQQITMLSSVPTLELRRHLAREMLRVLRPGGLVLSYDVATVGLLPRLLNRGLGALPHRPKPPTPPSSDVPSVTLRPTVPLDAPALRALFAGVHVRELRRLTPYRPLVERFSGREALVAALGRFAPLTSALLYVAEKPR